MRELNKALSITTKLLTSFHSQDHLVTSVIYLPPLVLCLPLESSAYTTQTFWYCPPFIHPQILYLTAAQTSLIPKCTAVSLWPPPCTLLYKLYSIAIVLQFEYHHIIITLSLCPYAPNPMPNPLVLPLKLILDLEPQIKPYTHCHCYAWPGQGQV